ncbi:MAG: hypothetical protein ACKOGH_20710, partial [Alphaproteobacteria bacterium]
LPGCEKWQPRTLDRRQIGDVPGQPEALEFTPDPLGEQQGTMNAAGPEAKVLKAITRLARAEWHRPTEQRIPQQP